MVAAIENGTVIDHIPSDRLFEVIRLLRIEELDHDTVFIGYPIWWAIAAWPANNFVKNNDFTGKTKADAQAQLAEAHAKAMENE